jgi:hypothetical protein
MLETAVTRIFPLDTLVVTESECSSSLILLQCLVRRFLRKALCVFFGRRYEKANCVVHSCSVKKLSVKGRVLPPLSCCNIRAQQASTRSKSQVSCMARSGSRQGARQPCHPPLDRRWRSPPFRRHYAERGRGSVCKVRATSKMVSLCAFWLISAPTSTRVRSPF